MKKSFTLFELIIVILISSIVIVLTSKLTTQIYQHQVFSEEKQIEKLDMLSTKLFIEKNIQNALSKLSYKKNTLFFGTNILLEKVTKFSMNNDSNYLYINIELNHSIYQKWIFKL